MSEAHGAATEMGRDLQLDDDALAAKYQKLRHFMLLVYKRRRFLRAADWLGDRIENLLLGSKLDARIEAPVFITGYFRSGTTMIERALSRHSAFSHLTYRSLAFPRAALTSHFLTQRFPQMQQTWMLAHQPNMEIDNSWPFEGEPIWRFCRQNPWSTGSSDVLSADYSDPAFERMFMRVINKHLRVRGARRFLSKNPPDIVRVGYLARIFPDARFIHIVRHPLRMLQSQLDMERLFRRIFSDLPNQDLNEVFSNTFLPPGRKFLRTARHAQLQALAPKHPALSVAMNIVDVEAARQAAVDSSRLHDRVHLVRYEDTLRDFRGEMRRIFAFVGLGGAEADAISEEQGKTLVQRNLTSQVCALPRFDDEVLAELAPLAAQHDYPRII
jgi:hypothetical protein